MLRLCERYGVDVNFHPKPLGVDLDWNGSGLHTNFSTKHMREIGGEEYFTALMSAFSDARDEHIACYGPENDLRLTGLHETAAIDEFTYGVADRGASIRIPHSFVDSGHRGYLEDRRPNSLGRPVPHHRPDPADDRVGHRAGADRGRVRGVGCVRCATSGRATGRRSRGSTRRRRGRAWIDAVEEADAARRRDRGRGRRPRPRARGRRTSTAAACSSRGSCRRRC